MSDAQLLLMLADATTRNHCDLLLVEDADNQLCAMTVVALRLRARPDLMLRALVEEWDRYRITKELY